MKNVSFCSSPRTRSQIGAINTQQVDTDGEYFYSLLLENECFAEMWRKCFISPQLWWGHVARGTWHVARVWVFAHSPNNCRECGGRYTGKYYSWRDYLESVLSILWWTLATTLCAPHWELWLPGNTQQIQHKKYYTTLKNIWLPMLLRERWRSGTEDVMRGSRQRCSGVTGTATTVTGLQPRDNCSAPT